MKQKPPEHKPTNVTDQAVILEIKLQEKATGLPNLLWDTMDDDKFKNLKNYMKKNGY